MASIRDDRRRRGVRAGLGGGLLIAALLLPLLEASGQDLMPRSVRPRDALKTAIDQYKRGDYEAAAGSFAQANAGQAQLAPTEQQDLGTFAAQNTTALAARQDGAAKLRQADDALKTGDVTKAANLLRTVNANQFLSASDRQLQTQLAGAVQTGNVQVAQPGQAIKPDTKSLLAAARMALAQKDYDTADALAVQAEKVGGAASWLQPFGDSPAKVRRDVQAERGKLAAAGQPAPETKGASSWLPGMPKIFGSDKPAPTVPQAAPTTNTTVNRAPTPDFNDPKSMGRKMIYDGFKALEANDLELA